MANQKTHKTRKRLYTDEQISDAYIIVRERLMEVLKRLGRESTLIAYMINPDSTAIGLGFTAHEDLFLNTLWRNVVGRHELEYDGNAGYTLLDLATMIIHGEI